MQHVRLLCPPLSPRLCSNSYSLNWWCYLTSHPLLLLSYFAFKLSQYQGLFQWVSSSHQVAKVSELQRQSFQWIVRVDFFLFFFFFGWFLLGLPDLISLLPKGLSSLLQYHNLKASILHHSAFFMIQLSLLYMSTGKTWFIDDYFFLHPHVVEGSRELSVVFSMSALTPFTRLDHHDLITTQKPHLLPSSYHHIRI